MRLPGPLLRTRSLRAASPARLNSLHRGQDDEGYWPAVAQRIGLVAQAESPSISIGDNQEDNVGSGRASD